VSGDLWAAVEADMFTKFQALQVHFLEVRLETAAVRADMSSTAHD
jgi:hypothetical protein